MTTNAQTPQFLKRMLGRYGDWTQKISGALMDQALFAGSNFALNILLARWMDPEGYGAFVLAYSWLMLALNVYDAVLIEPMAIFGSNKYAGNFKRYLGYLYYGHTVVALVIALILGLGTLASYYFDSGPVFMAMAGATLCAPFLLLRWLTRQPFYILSVPHWSALGGLIYFVVSLVILYGLYLANAMSAFSAMLAIGAAGVVSAWVMTRFFLKPEFSGEVESMPRRQLIQDHFEYGKWATGSRIMGWLPGNVFYIVMPLAISLSASATLRAIGTLFVPISMAIQAVNGIIIPSMVRTYEQQGREALFRRMRLVMAAAVGFTGLVAVVFTLFGAQIIHVLYDGKYDEFVTLPIIVTTAIFPVLGAIQEILDIGLRAMGLVRLTFWSKLVWGIGTVTIGIAMMLAYGLLGTNLGQMVTASIALGVTSYFYYGIYTGKYPTTKSKRNDGEDTPLEAV